MNDLKRVGRACLTAAPLLWACTSVDLEGLTLVSRVNALVIGDTVTLSLYGPNGSAPSAPTVAWSSSDSAIALVDELGTVTGTGPGWVLIEAATADYTLRVPLLVWETAGPFMSVDNGADHSCALGLDGSAWCWGSNLDAQIGAAPSGPDLCPSSGAYLACSAGAIPVRPDLSFTDVAVGDFHSCVLSTSGTAYCWGSNDRGQLGDGGTETRPDPQSVEGGQIFRSLAAGGRATCGITEGDALLCWGGGLFPAEPSADGMTTPTPVAEALQFAAVETTGDHTCGVTPDGATYCWGLNGSGQLGVATVDSTCAGTPCTREPQEVLSAAAFVDLALGHEFSCGLTADGVAHCWGANALGQLGDGTRTDRAEPMPVAGGHTFTRLAAARDHACGVDDAELLYCWGSDPYGFGNGEEGVEVDLPEVGAGGLAFTEISIGYYSQCGAAPSGLTWCWGSNELGAVGNGFPQQFPPITTPWRVIRHAG